MCLLVARPGFLVHCHTRWWLLSCSPGSWKDSGRLELRWARTPQPGDLPAGCLALPSRPLPWRRWAFF
eukprot:6135100-Alexandrium_andersonii.AAC.1